jgi:WD repeat-containing protein 76
MAAMTEYERKRQERIAQNQALLRDLELEAASMGFESKKRKATNSSSAPRPKRKPPQPKEPVEPTRRSLRVRGVKSEDEKTQKEYAKLQQEVEEANKAALAAKRRRIHGDLNISDITSKNNWLWDETDSNGLSNGDSKVKIDKDVKGVRDRLAKLSVWQGVEPNGKRLVYLQRF